MTVVRTPFRISFFGGGTDYPAWYKEHGGAVLSTTIDKYCYITCRELPPFFDHNHYLVWSKIEKVKQNHEIEHPAIRGIFNFLNIDKGVEVSHTADLYARSGLGSSSSFCVGLINAIYAMRGEVIDKQNLALRSIHVEQNVLGESVGSQDQVAASFGGLNIIEFGGDEHIRVTPLDIKKDRKDELQNNLIMFFTGIKRVASDVAKEQVKKTEEKESDVEKRLHSMRKLVDDAVGVLKNGSSIDEFGNMLHSTWELKRKLTSKISNPLIDDIYKEGRRAGALGGKLLGAGGGGFMLFYANPKAQEELKKKLHKLRAVPVSFDSTGSTVLMQNGSKVREA
jgi:D-glycero-alpha-D-manno-heptose-7-phosphate kinase